MVEAIAQNNNPQNKRANQMKTCQPSDHDDATAINNSKPSQPID